MTESHELYVAGVCAHARLQSDAVPLLHEALRANPANLRAVLALRELSSGAGDRDEVDRVGSLLRTASADEIAFAAAIRALRLPNAESAAELLEGHLRTNPGDTFVWTAAARHFGGGAVVAGRRRFLDICESTVGGAEPPDIVAARRAFALHETGRLQEAEILALEALAVEGGNGSAMHSLLHVHYYSGRHKAGLALAADWLARQHSDSPLRSHFGWHAAIHSVALGDSYEARRILNTTILERPSLRGITIDGPALLWRLHLRGESLSAEQASFERGLTGLGLHSLTPLSAACVAFGLALLGKRQELCELARESEARSDVRYSVACAVARGLVSWLDEDWAVAEKWLRFAKHHRWRLGGSRIQQETVDWTWRVAAAPRAGSPRRARPQTAL